MPFGIDDAVIIPAAASLISGLFGKKGVEDTNASNLAIARESNAFNAEQAGINRVWSAEQAQKSMDFSERMSNTQWTRGVADMAAAGLNPMLAYSRGGASAPSGAVGSTSAASAVAPPRMENAVAAGINSAREAYSTMQEGMRVRQDMRIREPQERLAAAAVASMDAASQYIKPISESLSDVVGAIEDKIRDNHLSSATVAQAASFVDNVNSVALDAADRFLSPARELAKSVTGAGNFEDLRRRAGEKSREVSARIADAARESIHGESGRKAPESRGKMSREVQRRMKSYEWKFNYDSGVPWR